ncbi:unnamed protein product [Polarella glacialis]|uniref:Uncharacterized protein n=1 Tax=Polarella glacialis TaxID=89957 RepID=A0A813ER49_POLGL|nr:unnamed protein product [Polarella glacialis]
MISSAYDKDTHSPWECDIPKTWPNSGSGHEDAAGVRSLRLFKAWSPAWPPEGRLASWKRLVKYIHQNDVLLLLGTSISCDVESDKQQWEWAKELMKMVGKRHILALAIGNEASPSQVTSPEESLTVSSDKICLLTVIVNNKTIVKQATNNKI